MRCARAWRDRRAVSRPATSASTWKLCGGLARRGVGAADVDLARARRAAPAPCGTRAGPRSRRCAAATARVRARCRRWMRRPSAGGRRVGGGGRLGRLVGAGAAAASRQAGEEDDGESQGGGGFLSQGETIQDRSFDELIHRRSVRGAAIPTPRGIVEQHAITPARRVWTSSPDHEGTSCQALLSRCGPVRAGLRSRAASASCSAPDAVSNTTDGLPYRNGRRILPKYLLDHSERLQQHAAHQ